jgi:hypothetical protein
MGCPLLSAASLSCHDIQSGSCSNVSCCLCSTDRCIDRVFSVDELVCTWHFPSIERADLSSHLSLTTIHLRVLTKNPFHCSEKKMVTEAPILIKYFLLNCITLNPLFVLVALDDVGPQHIGMSLMMCRLQKLDGANVPHGVGVRWGILLMCHGLFSCSKKCGFRTICEYVKNILRSHQPIKPSQKMTINHGTPPVVKGGACHCEGEKCCGLRLRVDTVV